MMALADDDDGDVGKVFLRVGGRVQLLAGLSNLDQFYVKDCLILAFRNAVAVYENVLRQDLVLRLPEAEPGCKHFVKVVNHLLPRSLDSNIGWPLAERLVNGGDNPSDTWSCICGSRRRMGNVEAHNHGLTFTKDAEFGRIETLIDPSEFQIEFQGDIGKVLRIVVLCKL